MQPFQTIQEVTLDLFPQPCTLPITIFPGYAFENEFRTFSRIIGTNVVRRFQTQLAI
jgi:hypothetical protein